MKSWICVLCCCSGSSLSLWPWLLSRFVACPCSGFITLFHLFAHICNFTLTLKFLSLYKKLIHVLALVCNYFLQILGSCTTTINIAYCITMPFYLSFSHWPDLTWPYSVAWLHPIPALLGQYFSFEYVIDISNSSRNYSSWCDFSLSVYEK